MFFYSFSLVGAGSAGSVLAARLSENPHVKVLVIEAGGNENIISDIPVAYQHLQRSHLDWQYLTESQEAACYGMNERVCILLIDFFYIMWLLNFSGHFNSRR